MRLVTGILVGTAVLAGILWVGYSASNLASAAGPQGKAPAALTGGWNVAPRFARGSEETPTEFDSDFLKARRGKGGEFDPPPALEKTLLGISSTGTPELRELPAFKTQFAGKAAGMSARGEYVFYTLDLKLQELAQKLVKDARVAHVAVVAMDPKSGKILALAHKSSQIKDLSLHNGLPAASLFKLVTTAAALENSALGPYAPVPYRGGMYTLNRWNYLPSPKHDRRRMSLAEALGKSCNPVFSHVALRFLTPEILRAYASQFGFNRRISSELDLPMSGAFIPQDDQYELGRTAAGFGEITLTPIHAAALVSGIANAGDLLRPLLVERVIDQRGAVLYRAKPESIAHMMQPSTARTLLEMMRFTTTVGTSRKEFSHRRGKALADIQVAAKTGTLSGVSPEGTNHWFVAAAPIEDPTIAVSVIVVADGRPRAKASHLGRQIIEKFLKG